MSKRYWITALALGLILSGSNAAIAQEVEESTQGQAEAEQVPAETAPIRVIVIEDEAEAQARKALEAESDEREKKDLTAQEGMNTATQRMADLAYWQTWLIVVGTVALIVTLYLTRQANRTLQEDQRAWLNIHLKSLEETEADTSTFRCNVYVDLKNFGGTPATFVQPFCQISVLKEHEVSKKDGFVGPLEEYVVECRNKYKTSGNYGRVGVFPHDDSDNSHMVRAACDIGTSGSLYRLDCCVVYRSGILKKVRHTGISFSFQREHEVRDDGGGGRFGGPTDFTQLTVNSVS